MKKYPFIDWLGYINAKMYSGLKFNETQRVIMQMPSYYDQLEAILNQTSKRTIANYVIWRELVDYVPYLTSDLKAMEFEFLKTVTGKATKQARWSDCVKSASGMFGIAVSSMYAREHFRDTRIRRDIGQITTEISSEFEKLLQLNEWMDVNTKAQALKKLQSMHYHIIPTELFDDTAIIDYYKSLTLNDSNFLQTAINVDNHGKEFACSRYHQAVNRTDWKDHASTIYVNANYNGKGNSIRKLHHSWHSIHS